MIFSSVFFLLYFLPAFLTIYFLLPWKYRNIFTLIASIFFFAWGAPKFVFVLMLAVVIDFYIAQLIDKNEGKKRKIFLAIGIVFNTSILLYFKYFNFFIENVNYLFDNMGYSALDIPKVILPIGISFFVFHELSYIIDVYRRVKSPMKNIIDYGLYIFLFPQLIAGPIIRFNEISDQIQNRQFQDNVDNRIIGFFRFAIGLSKKVLIANVLGEEADKIFGLHYENIGTIQAWTGAICYTFQIYFDFSGYSDMAIGLARIMGFVFPENFNHPYISQNITEFWKRWHMSLSRWMKDYLYIPLGGNKVSATRMYFNLCFVFLISGFWHGAQWTFIFWGAYHGFFLIIDRLFLIKACTFLGKIPSMILTFFLVLIGWVFFRSENINQAFSYLGKMFSLTSAQYDMNLQTKTMLMLAALISFTPLYYRFTKWESIHLLFPLNIKKAIFFFILFKLILMLCVGEITANGFNPFIYFKF